MNALRSYLTTAMLAAIACAFCLQLTDLRFRKYVKFIAGLCMLLVLTVPLFSLISQIETAAFPSETLTDMTLNGDSSAVQLIGRQLSVSIGDYIAERYDLPRSALSVTLTLDTADLAALRINSVEVWVTVECDEKLMAKELLDELGCPVSVRKEGSGSGIH